MYPPWSGSVPVPHADRPGHLAEGSLHLGKFAPVWLIIGLELTDNERIYIFWDHFDNLLQFIPVMLLLLASEQLHDCLPDLLVDADVEDRVDETVHVCKSDHLL